MALPLGAGPRRLGGAAARRSPLRSAGRGQAGGAPERGGSRAQQKREGTVVLPPEPTWSLAPPRPRAVKGLRCAPIPAGQLRCP